MNKSLLIALVALGTSYNSWGSTPIDCTNYQNPAQEELTIWVLQTISACEEGRQYIDFLFNHKGITLDQLPQNYSAGAGTSVAQIQSNGRTGKLVENVVGRNWRGKIFFPSEDPKKSHGLNRIKQRIFWDFGKKSKRIIPMAAFETELIDNERLKQISNLDFPEVKSSIIVLNYANPKDRHIKRQAGFLWVENVLDKHIQVYDVVVPIYGKDGSILYIGKTWIGRYDENGVFEAKNPDRLLARFYLDFSEAGLAEQQQSHWDGREEYILSPLGY